MTNIAPLGTCSIENIHRAFLQAFSDYSIPFQLHLHELQYLLHRRGFEPSLSYGAFDGDALVAFTLNCIGQWNGYTTVYDTGTGTIPQYRRQRLAAAIFHQSIPVLQAAGMQQYLLEVMQDNIRALELYQDLGFGVVRELDTLFVARDKLTTTPMPIGYHVETLSTYGAELANMWSINPSWQNAAHSVERAWNSMIARAVYTNNGEMVAYALLTPATGGVPQMAVAEPHRHKGIATALLADLSTFTNVTKLRVANVDSSYEPFAAFASQIGMVPGPKQYEMLLRW